LRDEKLAVALNSLLWAVALTSAKLITGLITDSLGVLSEALLSGLDLVAAAVTVYAVHQSAKPADADHQFGHGKVENLSALFETLLLLVTCVWIISEAVERLAAGHPPPLTSPWSFGVMLFAIGVDVHRARALARVAHKHGSQALEADALHFSSDVWSSTAVIVGLIAAAFGVWWADPVAALSVAAVILLAVWSMIRRSLDALLDRAPPGANEAVRRLIETVAGVRGSGDVRVRGQGHILHVDAVVRVDGARTLDEAHEVASAVERAVRGTFPGADVNVHVEPARDVPEGASRGQDGGAG